MSDNSLTITLGVDQSKLRADLAVVQAQMRAFGSELKRAANDSLKTGDTSALRGLATQFEAARARVAALTTTMREHTAAHSGFRGALMASHDALRDVRGRMFEFGQALSNTADRVFPHFREILAIGVGAALVEFVHKVKEANNEIRETENLSKALGFSTEEFEAAGLAASKFGVGQDELSQALARSARRLGELRVEGLKLSGDTPNSTVATLRGNMKNLADASLVARGGMYQLNESIFGTTATLRGGQQAAINLDKAFSDIANNPALRDADKQIAVAKRIDSIRDATLKAQLANREYGRSWVMVLPGILGMADGLRKAEEEIKKSGLGLQEYEKDQARTFKAALTEFNFYSARVQQIVLGALGSAFVPFFTEVTALFKENASGIRDWSVSTGKYLADTAKQMIDLLGGKGLSKDATELAKTLSGIGTAALVTFGILKTGFDLVKGAADLVAAAVNGISGGMTSLNGETIIALGLFVRMSNGVGILTTGFDLLTLAAKGFAATASLMRAHPIIALATVLALLAYKIYENWDTLKELWHATWNLIVAFAGWVGRGFVGAWDDAIKAITDIVGGFWKWLSGIFDKVIGKATEAAKAIGRALSGGGAGPAESGPEPGHAQGGYIRGRGTGTSDSIPIWASNGEYMVKAAAVSRVGVPVLDRINSGQMPGFAGGGLVGSSGGGATIHLHVGGREYPMTASRGVADSLIHEARTRHTLSAGRAPSWAGT